MRVLHVIPSLSRVHGGPTQALHSIEVALTELGVNVETVATDDEGRFRRSAKPCGVFLNENGVARRYFPKRTEFYNVAPAFVPWSFRHIRDYDVVHIHALFSFTSIVAAVAARYSGVPYVVRPLGTLTRYGITQRRPLLKRLSLALLEGPMLRSAAAVHFTSHDELREAALTGITMRGVVIPLGAEPASPAEVAQVLKKFPTLGSEPYLLYLSRLDKKKNVEGLLVAFKSCAAQFPDVNLLIAGDGATDYVDGLKMLANNLGLAKRVVWAGYVEGDLKACIFAGAMLFVLASYSENFGIAAAEALMAGLPCVLGEGVAISKEVADAGAGLVVFPESSSIAAALTELIGDKPRREGMSKAALILANDRYSVGAMVSR